MTTGKPLWSKVLLLGQQAQYQRQDQPNQRDPLGGTCQGLIQTLTGLAQVGIGIAGQCAGQAGLLAGLEHDHQHQCNTGNDLQNSQNDLNNFHLCNLPPTVLNRTQRMIFFICRYIGAY